MDFKVNYSNSEIPKDYKCCKCNAFGVKLWRLYQTIATHCELMCVDCAMKDQKKTGKVHPEGYRTNDEGCKTDQIGSKVPAVPCEDMDTFWGYCSIPEQGYEWWKNLPLTTRVR